MTSWPVSLALPFPTVALVIFLLLAGDFYPSVVEGTDRRLGTAVLKCPWETEFFIYSYNHKVFTKVLKSQ